MESLLISIKQNVEQCHKQISQPITCMKWIRGHHIFQTPPTLSICGCLWQYKFTQSTWTSRCRTADPLDTSINLILLLWMHRANLSQCFLPLAWLLIALSPMLDISILFQGLGHTLHLALAQSNHKATIPCMPSSLTG